MLFEHLGAVSGLELATEYIYIYSGSISCPYDCQQDRESLLFSGHSKLALSLSLPFHRLQTRSPNTTEQCSRPKKFECESIIIYLKTNYDNGPRIKAKAKGDIGWTIEHDRATVSWKLLAGSLSKGDAWRGNPANCLGHDQWELVPWNHSVTVQAAWRMSGLGG